MKWNQFYPKTLSHREFINNITVHLPFLKEILKVRPKKVLEVGSGTGTMSIYLSYHNIETYSVDNNEKVLENAKIANKKFGGKVHFVKADAFRLPFKNSTFDVAFHQGFFEHFTDEEIKKLADEQLRVGKKIIFSVPNNYYPRQDFGNERLLSKRKWRKIFSDFKIEKATNYFQATNFKKTILLKLLDKILKTAMNKKIKRPIMFLMIVKK